MICFSAIWLKLSSNLRIHLSRTFHLLPFMETTLTISKWAGMLITGGSGQVCRRSKTMPLLWVPLLLLLVPNLYLSCILSGSSPKTMKLWSRNKFSRTKKDSVSWLFTTKTWNNTSPSLKTSKRRYTLVGSCKPTQFRWRLLNSEHLSPNHREHCSGIWMMNGQRYHIHRLITMEDGNPYNTRSKSCILVSVFSRYQTIQL